ncbi:hypothetical protein GQ53DRAFT_464074 [Thozetella sp. PMI_491]|nr:hypothetical protein GQ53DRAFT_464074 [Thozetella sp. PMI_491]
MWSMLVFFGLAVAMPTGTSAPNIANATVIAINSTAVNSTAISSAAVNATVAHFNSTTSSAWIAIKNAIRLPCL